jgi:hypothetical protein
LEYLRVHVGECVPPVFEVGQLVTDFSGTLFDGAFVFGDLVEAVEGVVVELPAGIAVGVQGLSLAVGRLETIPVVVVHSTHFERDVTDISTLAVRSESSHHVGL